MNKLISGTNIIADNWQFMVVSNFLAGKADPNDVWGWVATTDENTLSGDLQAGVFQLDCLINLIEQIIFTNSISLMEQWIPSWANDNTDLNKLFNQENGNFIKPLDLSNFEIKEKKSNYLKQLLWNETVVNKFHKGMEEFERQDFENGRHLFWSQIINGIADYLALADDLSLAYSPHSARAGFLKSNLWRIAPKPIVSRGVERFHSIVNTSRTKLSELLGNQSALSKLTISIPSTAILCIAESTSSSSIIDVALQLRNNTEIKSLRHILHELTLSINSGFPNISTSFKDVKEKVDLLESIVVKVEKELTDTKKIEKNEVPSKIDIDYFNYKNYTSGIISTHGEFEHSGIISRLLLTSGTRTNEIISSKLKINGSKIFNQFINWHSQDFFEKVSSPQINQLYNIFMETNYTNNGITGIMGPDGKIINSQIGQNDTLYNESNIDIQSISDELAQLLAALKEQANKPEHFSDCALIAEAKEAADKGEKNKTLEILKKAGKWIFDTATQIGIRLTAAILKESMTK